MGRITRKMAAEVAEALNIDHDAALALDENNENLTVAAGNAKHAPLEASSRAPLGDLEPNSADNTSQSDDTATDLRKSTRTRKGGRKGAVKDNSIRLAASTASPADASATSNLHGPQHISPHANDSHASSPASEKAAEELVNDAETANIPVAVAPVKANLTTTKGADNATSTINTITRRLVHSANTMVAVEPKTLVDGLGQTSEERESMNHDSPAIGIPHINLADLRQALPIDAPPSPLPTAVPKPVAHLRADTPAKRSTSNKENIEPEDMDSPRPSVYDALEDAAVTAATPNAATEHQDPIAALDNLDDAVEHVSKDIPDVHSTPEKVKTKRVTPEPKAASPKKAAPVVRATKASQARISLAQNPDGSKQAPSLGRPRPSTTLGRSNSVRQTSTTSNRTVSGTSTRDSLSNSTSNNATKKEVIIPHSKPRPVSLIFPAPPQPIKSTKAPTQSTFQLPGEAIAAKLKAAREARLAKESEDERAKKTFKARPVPSSLNRAPSVRHTNASKARESLGQGGPIQGTGLKASTSASGTETERERKRVTLTTHQRAQSVASGRVLAAVNGNGNGTARGGASTNNKTHPSASNSKARLSASTTTSTIKKRPSTALANIGKARTSIGPPPQQHQRAPTTATQASNATQKGKEVFNRPAFAKAAAEKERLEKESAAKKARADAAERGRLASREWAEKQKRLAAAKKVGSPAAKVVEEEKGEDEVQNDESALSANVVSAEAQAETGVTA